MMPPFFRSRCSVALWHFICYNRHNVYNAYNRHNIYNRHNFHNFYNL